MKLTLFFLTLFLMFTACKKVSKEDTTVEFQIIDASTQTGYANVK
ncbi:MAG: basic membrane lipoprotein Med (substrate-binding protein (PBP1-ABC) superfamily), partial [Psychromonas sp.]